MNRFFSQTLKLLIKLGFNIFSTIDKYNHSLAENVAPRIRRESDKTLQPNPSTLGWFSHASKHHQIMTIECLSKDYRMNENFLNIDKWIYLVWGLYQMDNWITFWSFQVYCNFNVFRE